MSYYLMKNKKMKNLGFISALTALSIFISTPVLSETSALERLKLDMERDENGNFRPNLFVPYYWSDNWYSGLGYRDKTLVTQDTLEGLVDSKLSTSISERIIRLNVVSYQGASDLFSYSVGLDYQNTAIDKIEFGYFSLNNDFIVFDNNVEIEVSGFSAHGDLTWSKLLDPHAVRVKGSLSPMNSLKVEQQTDIKPLVPITGVGNSTKAQELSYQLQIETRHDLIEFLSVGLDLEYKVLPLNYDLKVLATSADKFITAPIDTTESTSRFGLRFIFNNALGDNMFPVIGVAYETTEIEDNLNETSSKVSQTLLTAGLTGRF